MRDEATCKMKHTYVHVHTTYREMAMLDAVIVGITMMLDVMIARKVGTRRTTVMLTVVLMIGRSTGMLLLSHQYCTILGKV